MIRGTLVKQVQYGDMVVPPNNIFSKLKDREVSLAGYTYVTFAENDHRIVEELQVGACVLDHFVGWVILTSFSLVALHTIDLGDQAGLYLRS